MIIDAHVHLETGGSTVQERVDHLLRYADKLGIARVFASMGPEFRYDPTPEELRHDNDFILAAIEYCPDRIGGFCYASPAYPQASVAELDRCIAHGPMRGVKLWVSRLCDDPGADPIVERATELGVPVLQHTWIKATGNLPNESRPEHLVTLARRHPKAQFIMAHSGGDWQRGLRIVRNEPNIAVDLSGGNPEQGQAEEAVRLLGADRVVWGSDAGGRSFASQLAKVLAADLPENCRQAILSENIRRMTGT